MLETEKGDQRVSYCSTKILPLYQLVWSLLGLGKVDHHTFALVSSSGRASQENEMVLRYFAREN